MRIKNRLFPYPSIQAGNGVYKSAKFNSSVSYTVEGSRCKLIFEATVSAPEIQALIDDGQAVFAFHLECGRTYFRRMITFCAERYSFILDGNEIDRNLEICPMIVATQDINGFFCTDLSEIYSGEEISFEKGDIIAVGDQRVLTIVKEKDALKKLSSIFYVDAYPDGVDTKHMTLSYGDEQIGILIPKNDATRFSQCKDDPKR